ncbi:hypothetical protein DICVIV_04074 [Dictyocaulus viviparus]|uniref:Uncharacterized protein n=1 Tax=Dictyocaulus viviparus TaxID=29172 RepID=A0A0D8Y5I5_DICVI|nr:hypothetical protein DICVIV_04074 [Dictyocaulus viviparus]
MNRKIHENYENFQCLILDKSLIRDNYQLTKKKGIGRGSSVEKAVFLVIVLCWARILMKSLTSLLFIATMVELYFPIVFSSLVLLKKKIFCYNIKSYHLNIPNISCSLESRISDDLYVEEIVVDGPRKSSLLKLNLRMPCLRIAQMHKFLRYQECVLTQNTGGSLDASQASFSSTSSSQNTGNYPVIVDAVLAANTVEDIAETHPDFARLLMDCYSAGCDLEEYRREFQRLKNLRIKRQGGVNQTLSFSLFPSVPSDLPSHLFVRLLKFHSLYEGACRKYLADVVNKNSESAEFPSDLTTIVGVNDSASEAYFGQECHFDVPGGDSQLTIPAEVSYSPAFSNSTLTRHDVASSSNLDDHLGIPDNNSYHNMQKITSTQPYSLGHSKQESMQSLNVASFVNRDLTTPLSGWSHQQVNASGMRSQLATALPPLETRQCSLSQAELRASVPCVGSHAMTASASQIHTRQFLTPVPRPENRQSCGGTSTLHPPHYQPVPVSEIHDRICEDNQRIVRTTPLSGASDVSVCNQVSPFATPTKKRSRRKTAVLPQANQTHQHTLMNFQCRQMTSTPISGSQQHQITKSLVGIQRHTPHVHDGLDSSATSLQQQSTTSASGSRRIMDSAALPAWGSQQMKPSNTQCELSPLVSSLPPLFKFTASQAQQGDIKISYPSVQNRQTSLYHSQSEDMSTRQYDTHAYPHSREMASTNTFAQNNVVNVPYGQVQDMSQMNPTSSDVYQQQSIPYQWQGEGSLNLYRQHTPFVQHASYDQQSQFDQQVNTGNQQQNPFTGTQSVQYSTQGIHPQQVHYLQPTTVQKVSAFSQPFNYVHQSYQVSNVLPQQSPYSQSSNFSHVYSQESACAQQQTEQQQRNQTLNVPLQQHLQEQVQLQQQTQQYHQEQRIPRQIYESPAHYSGDQYRNLDSSFNSTHSVCGLQNSQHDSRMQGHQMSRVSDAGALQHGSEISTHKEIIPEFVSQFVDMDGLPSSGVVGMVGNHNALTSNEVLKTHIHESNPSYSELIPSAMSGSTALGPMIEGGSRTFSVTQCLLPPRNDSEATVPARTSPNSCSPEMITADDESSSLIPTLFYPKDFSQNDYSAVNIQDSPIEKGLNCQHFRFDIILAMKHHRIKKEDYERTLLELDKMEEEKCVGPLGDLLMKRLGLKRQEQQSCGGKFSVDELVAAFAANAKICESRPKISERRESSELLSEFFDEMRSVSSNSHTNYPGKRDVLVHSGSSVSPVCRSDVLHSLDAISDFNCIISDENITEFDSLTSNVHSEQKSFEVAAPESSVRCRPSSVCSRNAEETSKESAIFGDLTYITPSSQFLSSQKTIQAPLSVDEHQIFFSESFTPVPISYGQPAAFATNRSLAPDAIIQTQTTISDSKSQDNLWIKSDTCQLSRASSECTLSGLSTALSLSHNVTTREPSPANDFIPKTVLSFGAPAQPARRTDPILNSSSGEVSSLVIDTETLLNEAECRDKKDPTSSSPNKSARLISAKINESSSILQHSPEDPKYSVNSDDEFNGYTAITIGDSSNNDKGIGNSGDNNSYTSGNDSITSDKHNFGHSTRRSLKSMAASEKSSCLVEGERTVDAELSSSLVEDKSQKESKIFKSSLCSRQERSRNPVEEGLGCSPCKPVSDEHIKKSFKKASKSVHNVDFFEEPSKEISRSATTSRPHHITSYPSFSSALPRRSRTSPPRRTVSPRSMKRKNKKSSALKLPKEQPSKCAPSKFELSREILSKQIAEIIEEERNKLPHEESKLPRRQLSPTTLNVVIQDLMQHHISEDTSPNRDLFASKLLGTDMFSKLFFRAGKCVFRHYEELEDFRSKEKGRGRRKGGSVRKRDTELLRGIRKSREVQKYRDAVRAAREPSEAEKAAAAEKAKLEAMPWLARSTFKPDVQQGSSSRFVIPKKSSTSFAASRKGGESSSSAVEAKRSSKGCNSTFHWKSNYQSVDEETAVLLKVTTNDKIIRKSQSPPLHAVHKSSGKFVSKFDADTNIKHVEISTSFSFYGNLKSSSCKARVKYTWPLKRSRSASALIHESENVNFECISQENTTKDNIYAIDSDKINLEVDSDSGVTCSKVFPVVLSEEFPTTSYVSENESQLAALALQEEMSRNDQSSPDCQYDALSFLASMPESEFSAADESSALILPPTQHEMLKLSETCTDAFDRLSRVDDQFEQVDWIKIDQVSDTFSLTDFDADPWIFPLSTYTSLSNAEGQNNQVVTSSTSVATLYSSLQEELDAIVRDTLEEGLYSQKTMGHVCCATPVKSEILEWPKAHVPLRSYTLDVILPKLSCDRAKIPILDLCCCQRCLTRCVYYCDEDEWKFLYDSAMSRRKKVENEQITKNISSFSNDCTIYRELCKDFVVNEHANYKWCSFLCNHKNQCLSVIQAFPDFCEFTKNPSYQEAKICLPIYNYKFETNEFTESFAGQESCEFMQQPFVEKIGILWPELQCAYDHDTFSIFCLPKHIVFQRHSNQATTEIVLPFYQRLFAKFFMALSSSVPLNLHHIEIPAGCSISLPIPNAEFHSTCIFDVKLMYSQGDNISTTKATINIPHTSFDSLSLFGINATFGTPYWISVRSNCFEQIRLPEASFAATALSTRYLIMDKKRQHSSSSTTHSLPICHQSSTSLAFYSQDITLLRCEHSLSVKLSVPVPLIDSVFYQTVQLRVRRKRIAAAAYTFHTIPIPRFDAFALNARDLRFERRRRNSESFTDCCLPLQVKDVAILVLCELNVCRSHVGFKNEVVRIFPLPRKEYMVLNIVQSNVLRKRLGWVEVVRTLVKIPRTDLTVFSVVESSMNYIRKDYYELFTVEKEKSFKNNLKLQEISKKASTVLPIPRENAEVLRLSTIRMFRKRKYDEETFTFAKKLALEDRADFFLTEKSFCCRSVRANEVVLVKDPRLPLKCSNSFMEISVGWRNLAHRHMLRVPYSSYLVTQFASLLQRVFNGAIERCSITMKDLDRFLSNSDCRYNLDVFTNPQKVLISDPISSGPIWNNLLKLRLQRNSTELLDRKSLAPLYIFLGKSNLPRIGKPWRKWLKPLETTTDSRIGFQLALCMRIPDLTGVDDMEDKLQAIKMWWTFMMLRGTVPWFIYPCFSRRQLFILVRLLEALENVERPPFCLYPPKVFFKAVRKLLCHPRMDLIPKDVYHPDITTMVTLLRTKRNRVFHVDRSLPELLSHWMDDMNKIDAYLADDVTISAITPSVFLTQSEWIWKNYNQGCVPEWIEYNRNVSLAEITKNLTKCQADVSLPLEQRKKINSLKIALNAWSKYDSGPSIDQIPVDIINPFALSASLIELLPMPKDFVEECFEFLEKVSKKSCRPFPNTPRKSTNYSSNLDYRTYEKLAGKFANVTKTTGKTTINKIFEEFWKCPKEFSSLSVFNEREVRKQRSIGKLTDGKTEVPVKSSSYSTGANTSCSQKNIRIRKRKNPVMDEFKVSLESSQPTKKSRFEMRKRCIVRIKEEEGPSLTKYSMSKIPEHRQVKLRHTLARRGAETEKMLHETWSCANAILTAQGSKASFWIRKSEKPKRCRSIDNLSSGSDSRITPLHSTKSSDVKKRRPATIFNVANFEWVLKMSLRRPRAFVGLYKTMKYQYRILEKRRWVRRNWKLYDKAQFEKFMHENNHSEAEMLVKARLLKAENDMENVLGVKHEDVKKTEKFVIMDLTYWYGISRRYAERAEILAKNTLEKALLLDKALESLSKQKLIADEQPEEEEISDVVTINKIVPTTLDLIVQNVENIEHQEMQQYQRETDLIKTTLVSMINQVEQNEYHNAGEPFRNEPTMEFLSPMECDTAIFIPTGANNKKEKKHDHMQCCQNAKEIIVHDQINMVSKDLQCIKFPNIPVPPLFHVQNRLPLTSAYILMIINTGVGLKPQIPFRARFKRPRRVDNDVDFTDEEWEDYYEKKNLAEDRLLPSCLSWSSYQFEEDANDEVFESIRHQPCSCGISSERANEWVANLPAINTRKCYSEELLVGHNVRIEPLIHRIPMRRYSMLSCVSMERLPILEPPSYTSSAKALGVLVERYRRFSSPCNRISNFSRRQRSVSLPPSWKPKIFCLLRKDAAYTLCESRRNRLMYQRALSSCRYRIYSELNARHHQHKRSGEWSIRTIYRERDLPEQWIRRNSSHQHDLIKMARHWLEFQTQRKIPVIWNVRPDNSELPILEAEKDLCGNTPTSQIGEIIEPRECQLEYPVAVYNPPPSWNMLTKWSQSEKRTDVSGSFKYSSSEPSAFQRVLARPQPIDTSKLDVELENDDDSNDKIPQWPLLKKLRVMERELLAAGNPVAIERQRVRQYNRQMRNDMYEYDIFGDHLLQLQQIYQEYVTAQQLMFAQVLSASCNYITQEQQGLLQTMEQQQQNDQRWYSLLREEQQLTKRRTKDAVLTDMQFLRPESYEEELYRNFNANSALLSNIFMLQKSCNELINGSEISDINQLSRTRDHLEDQTEVSDDEATSIEVLAVEPEDVALNLVKTISLGGSRQLSVPVKESGCNTMQDLTVVISGATADPNIDTERESVESIENGRGLPLSITPTTTVATLSCERRTGLSPEIERKYTSCDNSSTSPEL